MKFMMSVKRKDETAAWKQEFGSKGRDRYKRLKNPSKGASKGKEKTWTQMVQEAYIATGEPVFLEAIRVADLYGFNCDRPLQRMREVGVLVATKNAIPHVEKELRRQKENCECSSLRRAHEKAALVQGVEAPTLEAARKRVEMTHRMQRSDSIPSGYAGRSIYIARMTDYGGEPNARLLRVTEPVWYPDNVDTRQMLAEDRSLVVIAEQKEPERAPEMTEDALAAINEAASWYALRQLSSEEFEGATEMWKAALVRGSERLEDELPGWRDKVDHRYVALIDWAKSGDTARVRPQMIINLIHILNHDGSASREIADACKTFLEKARRRSLE